MSHLLPADMCLKGVSHNRPQLTMGNSRDSVGRARGCLIRAAALVLGAQGRNRPAWNRQETRTPFGKNPHILQSLRPSVHCFGPRCRVWPALSWELEP